jgi:selenobiotic family peptide radical SAM maturase
VQHIFPYTSRLLDRPLPELSPDDIVTFLRDNPHWCESAPYCADCGEIELTAYRLRINPPQPPEEVTTRMIHPGVRLLRVQWSDLPALLRGEKVSPQQEEGFVVVYGDGNGKIEMFSPTGHELLALKLVGESIDSRSGAEQGGVSIGYIEAIIDQAESRGLIISPPSRLIRAITSETVVGERYLRARIFTLQWHITQACDLHCRHCYDRSSRRAVELFEGIRILDDFYDFCRHFKVRGQVSFSGGNPFLHPDFTALYKGAAERGFTIGILGNPTTRQELQTLIDIKHPAFMQVSLEGLAEHNDYIRGTGHFSRTINFLSVLKTLRIYSMVMLTLTRANRDQVLPLAEYLRDKVNLFTFNRLALSGEGASLASVPPADFKQFLADYLKAAAANPIMGTKDNLFNIIRHEEGAPVSGGCTGFGCGAAFNFVALLPDGEVYGCRKALLPIGTVRSDSLITIYDSTKAHTIRDGSSACMQCELRPVCGSCLAITTGLGLNPFAALDPYCFKEPHKQHHCITEEHP